MLKQFEYMHFTVPIANTERKNKFSRETKEDVPIIEYLCF